MTPETSILALWCLATGLAAWGIVRHTFRWWHRRRLLRALEAAGVDGAVRAEARAHTENEVFRLGLKAALFVTAAAVMGQRLVWFPGATPTVTAWVLTAGVLWILLWLMWWTLREDRR